MLRSDRRSTRNLSLAAAALGLVTTLLGAGPAEHRIFLSAHAPAGAQGAQSSLAAACSDTSRRDTLYMSFEPAQDESTLYGFSGELHIYAQPGDTLGSFWAMERGGANNGGLVIQFGPDESFPQPQPWGTQGIGSVQYERTPYSARFRFLYVLPQASVGPVQAGRRYVVGRMLLGARHAGLEGCQRPVCLEWHSASFAYGPAEQANVRHGGSRWLPRGATEADCVARLPAWRPKPPPAAPGGAR